MTRSCGRGERVRQRVPRKRGTNVTPVGALALRGWAAALSFSGSVEREAFDAFVTESLAPRLGRADVVLPDNLRALRLITTRGGGREERELAGEGEFAAALREYFGPGAAQSLARGNELRQVPNNSPARYWSTFTGVPRRPPE